MHYSDRDYNILHFKAVFIIPAEYFKHFSGYMLKAVIHCISDGYRSPMEKLLASTLGRHQSDAVCIVLISVQRRREDFLRG